MKPNGSAWRHGRARLDLSAKEAAERLRIAHRYLLNIESNQPAATPSERLVYRAAALYGCTFADLVDDEDAPADEPAEEPNRKEREPDPSGPPPRRNGKSNRRGPARDTTEMRAAS